MQKVRAYDLKAKEHADYKGLLFPDGDYLLWDAEKIKGSQPGEHFYFVNRYARQGLFTVLSPTRLKGQFNPALNVTGIMYEGHCYRAAMGREFVRFDILGRYDIQPDWKWMVPTAYARLINLWEPGIKRPEAPLKRIEALERIFNEGPALDLLQQCRTLLQGLNDHPAPAGIYENAAVIEFPDAHRHILMAIKTKPFVLLAGLSGVGKSRLVRTLAYKTCFEKELQEKDKPGNFELIKVKPDWHDSAELLGHTSWLSGKLRFHVTAFMRFVVKAWRYPHIPFFVCLDEMNLAPVEQYFAEFLSILETRRFEGNTIYSDAFISREDIAYYSQQDAGFWERLGVADHKGLRRQLLQNGITMPPNLVVIGTVNMDETTHSFSRKVLDRAMTIEMNDVDLKMGLHAPGRDWEYPDRFILPEMLLGRLQGGYEAYRKNVRNGEKIIRELQEIDRLLTGSAFRFAYRVRDEILVYCAHNAVLAEQSKKAGNWLNTCLDEMILMKILSRIEGDDAKCGEIIRQLLKWTDKKFPESNRKLEQMLNRLHNWGYTSFWQ